jgi:hypothetical protein
MELRLARWFVDKIFTLFKEIVFSNVKYKRKHKLRYVLEELKMASVGTPDFKKWVDDLSLFVEKCKEI